MSDPIYRRELLRLAADATGAGKLAAPHGCATAHNPACGDKVTMEVRLENGRIAALAHQTEACVLTQASAAILAAEAKGLTPADLQALQESIKVLLAGGAAPPAPFEAYGAFAGVAEMKGRHVCVLLPLQAALKALEDLGPTEPGA